MTALKWQRDTSTLVSKVFVRANLPYVVAGGLEGNLWIANGDGMIHETDFSGKPEISHIETVQGQDTLLLAAGSALMSYNLNSGQLRQLRVEENKISCISLDDANDLLYLGLWTNNPKEPNLLAYRFSPDRIGAPLWKVSTGNVVRSIYQCGEPGSGSIVVGSENRSVYYIDAEGQFLDTFEGPNRITRLRIFSHDDHLYVLILSDAAKIPVLELKKGDGLEFKYSLSLDARPRNAFFYREGNSIYLVAITPHSLNAFSLRPQGLEQIWKGNSSQTFMKSLYWWQVQNICRFVVERRNSSLFCYEAADNKLDRTLLELLSLEKKTSDPRLTHTYMLTGERAYASVISNVAHTVYTVTGDAQLLRAPVRLKPQETRNLGLGKSQLVYSAVEGILRTVQVVNCAHDELVFFAGESGILYRHSIENNFTMSTSLYEYEKIFDSMIINMGSQQALLLLSQRGLHLYDTDLTLIANLLQETDELRCLYWDDWAKKAYFGAESGNVYEVPVPLSNQPGTDWNIRDAKVIWKAQKKVRCIRKLRLGDEHLILIGAEDGYLCALDDENRQRWSYLFGQWIRDFELITSLSQKVVAAIVGRQKYLDFVSVETGKRVARYELPYEPRSINVFQYRGHTGLIITEIESNVNLYTFDNDQTLVGLPRV